MSTLLIRCPNTGEPISTGIEIDDHSLKQVPDVLSHSQCPLCGIDHAWWKHEAWLADHPVRPVPHKAA
jgi:hypothetical protein